MAKRQITQDGSAGSATQQGKQEKKQARREAKAMLAVDVAREKLAAAERKLAKAQLRLEIRRTSLQAAEAHLAELRNAHQPADAAEDAEEVFVEAAVLSDSDGSPGYFEERSTTGGETAQVDEASSSSDAENQMATNAENETAHTAHADNSPAAEQSSEERSASDDEDLLPEDNLPASEAEVDVTPTGEAAPSADSEAEGETTSEQAEQAPWWKSVSGNQGQHEG